MLKTAIRGVSIKGIVCAVPAFREDLMTSSGNGITLEEATKLANSTGVYARCLANEQICSSDLCYQASVRLLDLMNIDVSTIDILLFVSQTPDYMLPATSATLHKRLGCTKKLYYWNYFPLKGVLNVKSNGFIREKNNGYRCVFRNWERNCYSS